MSNLAIAYAMKRKKKMAEGGDVRMEGREGNRRPYEEQKNQKGVHTPRMAAYPSESYAGYTARSGGPNGGGVEAKTRKKVSGQGMSDESKKEHARVISESRSMPAPNLKGLAYGGETDEDMDPQEHIRDREEHQKGVHQTASNTTGSRTGMYSKMDPEHGKELHRRKLEEMKAIHPKMKGLAEGGDIKSGKQREDNETGVHKKSYSTGREESDMGYNVRTAPSFAKNPKTDLGRKYQDRPRAESRAVLAESKAIKPNLKGLADGGFVEEENMSGYVDHEGDESEHDSDHQPEDEMDMIGRIMKKREMSYSEGGKVADGGEDELPHMADSDPNNFDDLSMRDDLTSEYTGSNSGDEDGNERLDEDEKDIVERIMRSRSKKDRLPSPR